MWQARTGFITCWVLMIRLSRAEQNMSVVLRDKVTLFCSTFPIAKTSWFGPGESGKVITYTTQGQTLILDSVPQRKRLLVEVVTSPGFDTSSLTVADTMKTDAGTYTCSDGKGSSTFTIQITDPNLTVYVTWGKQSILPCPLTSVINNLLEWYGPPDDTTYNSIGTTKININGLPADFVSRLAVNATTGALVINNTQLSDDNLYKCKVGGPLNYVQLTVLVSPQNPIIINRTEEIKPGRRVIWANEESLITLVCLVSRGIPKPFTKWIRSGMTEVEVPSSNSSQQNPDGTYDITSIVNVMARRLDDRVMYVCQAEHIAWTSPQNTSVELYLNLKPSEPVMSDPGKLQENITLSTTCSTSGCRPAANITWFGVGTLLPTTSIVDQATETFNVTSTFQKIVTRQDNGATLQCIVTHPALSTSLVTSRNISVWFPPTNVSITNNREVTAGDKLILRCNTGTSNPIANISWMNSTSTPNGELSATWKQPGQHGGQIWYQNLTITSTRYMDGNIITCSAENPQTNVPRVSDNVVLSVMYNPDAVISNGSLLLVNEGDTNVTLLCASESKPISNFTWIKDAVTLKTTEPKSDNRDTYTIFQVNRTHFGEYSCIASNGIAPNGQANASLNVQFSPINVSITNNKEVTAGIDKLVLRCTTGTSSPTANITWRNGTSSTTGVLSTSIDEPGAYGGKVRYQDLTIIPSRYMDSSTITCTAQNSANTGPSVSDSVILNVKFSPIVKVSITTNMTITEGEGPIIVQCSASSKPISYFTLRKEGLTNAISEGPGSQDNQHDYIIQRINRTYAGIYSCTANNSVVGPEDEMKATVDLVVQYPPDVTVYASNVTTNDVRARIVCMPHGIPDRYTFSIWQHLWPGYNETLRFLPSTNVDLHNATLDLNLLSYQDSGIYKCGASNGVKAAGTQDVIKQMDQVYVLVKAPPVILRIPKKVGSGIGSFIAIQLDYYSNTDAGHLTMQHSNSSKLHQLDSVEEIQIDNLPVYSNYVPALVFRGNFNISIDKQEEFGNYTVNVSNSIGFDVATLEIKQESEPGKPYNLSSSNSQKNQITLSWYPGFHGGFNQTFVIQVSLDNILWQNASLVPGGKGEEQFNTTITKLKPNTVYYFRIYAFNLKGNGDLADEVISDKTSELEEPLSPSPQNSTIIGGAVGGTVAAVALVVVLILFIRRRTSLSEKSMDKERTQRKRPESGLVDNPMYDTSDSLPGVGSTVAEYAMVVKPKKTAAQIKDPSSVYAQVDKKTMRETKGTAKGNKGKISRGDIYENADLARKHTNSDNLYENSGHLGAKNSGENVYEDPGAATSNGPLVNMEGILYADLMLDAPKNINGMPVIRGIENRTVYADIAYGKRGDLLPDSDDEIKKTSEKK